MYGVRPNTFKIVQLNAENLFLFLDDLNAHEWRKMSEKDWQRLSNSTVTNKSLIKSLWLAESLLHIAPDIICMNEVGGLESLTIFAQHFLGGQYVAHMIEGNSDRGIDIGYLVRKDFPLRAELHTHKERPLGFQYPHEVGTAKKTFFSRDCAELRLYNGASTRPELVLLLVHLKSKLDPENMDPMGRERRRAEFNTLVDIYNEVRAEFTPKVPVAIAGDFNGCARPDQLSEEFEKLGTTDWSSVVELAGISDENAATQVQFTRGGKINYLQIDYIFISPELKPHLVLEAVGVYRYHSDLKVELKLPKTLEQRTYMPSDHYPVIATFKRFWK